MSPCFDNMGPPTFTDLPAEILLDICHHLDLEAISALIQVNKSFHSMIQSHRVGILLPILQREFSPFDELLQVFTASDDDIDVKGQTYQPKRVVFRRQSGNGSIVLASGGFVRPDGAEQNGVFTKVRKGGKVGNPGNLGGLRAPETVILGEDDLKPLLKFCYVVRQWEEIFPQLRWIKKPEYCRFLEAHEQHRFRRALYRWWLYAFYFHGDLPRPRVGQPLAFMDDVRTCHTRMHPTSELVELLDLLAAVFHLVQHYICPTLEQGFSEDCVNSQAVEAQVRWNDQSRLGCIIRTYTKLDPKELIYYFDRIYSYPKKRLITDIRLRHPTFLNDQESLQAAIRSTLDERHWLGKLPSPTDIVGGIVDFGDCRDEERERLSGDASWDGSLPKPATYIGSHSQYNPRGDDGAGNDEWSYPNHSRRRDRLALSEEVY